MLYAKLYAQRPGSRVSGVTPSGSVILRAIAPMACETLEARRLLTTYEIPSGHSVAYLLPGPLTGQVEVHIDVPNDPNPFLFGNASGLDIIDAGDNQGFTFIDRVPAALKPTGLATQQYGIKVQADSGSNATLRIETKETNNDDRAFIINQSTTSETRIESQEITGSVTGRAYIGTGVTNLYIRTNDFTGAQNYWPTFPNPGTLVSVPNLAPGIHLTVDTGISTYAKTVLGSEGIGYIHDQATVITGAGHSLVTAYGKDLDHLTLALVDFGPRETAGNNRLEVLGFSTVTLDQVPGSSEHVVVVEYAKVDGNPFDNKPALLLVADQSTIDDLDVFSGGRAVVEPAADGTSIPLFDIEELGSASIDGNSTIGILTNEGDLHFTHQATQTIGPTTVDQFKIGAGTTLPTSSGNVVIDTDADVTILAPTTGHSPSRIGDLRINQGALLTVASHTNGPRVLGVGTVFIEKTYMTPMGTLDLNDNSMIVDYSGDSPVADVRHLLFHANNADNSPNTGPWTDFGITSSTAAGVAQTTGPKTGFWYGEATDLFTSFPATWEGQNLDNSTVLLKYAYYGDANLDGRVNLQDFNRLAANFGGTDKRSIHAEFTYDGNVNLQDFNRLAANFGAGTDPSTYDDYTTQELEEMLPE